ncbi:30S ribosome-binding factor RbfA [Compostibacter hankyongensis]|uniref:Ribosome-binding factor A n=1 Tax=Compostibacter hankyongensis TaxID=1007089 RepID=A0ABP8FF96_9BACT
MEEGKRQKQVGKLIQQELSDILRREGLNVVDGGMISVSAVRMTPDLLEARVYLSLFNIADTAAMLERIKERGREIKKVLAAHIKNQVRRIPELQFFLDDTLDHVFKMEALFKQIHDSDASRDESGEAGRS